MSDNTFSRQKKRKASIGDPAPAQQKAKKSAAKPQLPEGDKGETSISQWAKPKKKVTSKIQPDIHSESEESDKGEGPSNAAQYVLHILQHATANKAAPSVSGNLFAQRSNCQSTKTIQR